VNASGEMLTTIDAQEAALPAATSGPEPTRAIPPAAP